eukprot:239698-Chlamydomonas_euryale.AAC.3
MRPAVAHMPNLLCSQHAGAYACNTAGLLKCRCPVHPTLVSMPFLLHAPSSFSSPVLFVQQLLSHGPSSFCRFISPVGLEPDPSRYLRLRVKPCRLVLGNK